VRQYLVLAALEDRAVAGEQMQMVGLRVREALAHLGKVVLAVMVFGLLLMLTVKTPPSHLAVVAVAASLQQDQMLRLQSVVMAALVLPHQSRGRL
jgi:hypothetical protein